MGRRNGSSEYARNLSERTLKSQHSSRSPGCSANSNHMRSAECLAEKHHAHDKNGSHIAKRTIPADSEQTKQLSDALL